MGEMGLGVEQGVGVLTEEKQPVVERTIKVDYPDNPEKSARDFVFKVESFRSEIPQLKIGKEKNISGFMDRDGQIYWYEFGGSEEMYPVNLVNDLTGLPPVAYFEINNDEDRLMLASTTDGGNEAAASFLQKASLSPETQVSVDTLRATRILRHDGNPFIGTLKGWQEDLHTKIYEKFIPDSEIIRQTGYELVDPEHSTEKINELYEKVKGNGHYLVARMVGTSVLPKGWSSGSFYAPPNHTDLFDSSKAYGTGQYDKGVEFFEVPKEAFGACFRTDASTALYPSDQTPALRPDQSLIDLDSGTKLLYRNTIEPVKPEDLLVFAGEEEGGKYYSEVVINFALPEVKLVGVVNPYDVFGWSKMAYEKGVLEFMETPEFSAEAKKAQRLTNHKKLNLTGA